MSSTTKYGTVVYARFWLWGEWTPFPVWVSGQYIAFLN